MSEANTSETPKAKRSDAEDAAVWERFAGRPGEDAKVSAVHRLRIAEIEQDAVTHGAGCGSVYSDSYALCGLLAGYITHPNVAGATVLS